MKKQTNADAELALELLAATIAKHGNWDDNCFYYAGKAAPELQEPLRLAEVALKGDKNVLPEFLEKARQEIAIAIAFLGRDYGTERLPETVTRLLPGLARADRILQRAVVIARGD